ncbi:hypothetical protein QJ856_gp0963 [Tupanvirus deep ocean]|uniref:Uncharacterized protein n=2 Tax=Tupanvirus TaxID=2094720 RepID=A0AC62A7N6_9VIRU|nr:hypothetical protein QJ856_gp0963 [Tupanvirus deep ocean]QKU33794.1 hypothetical protein [Tupanvirus deep ocean]
MSEKENTTENIIDTLKKLDNTDLDEDEKKMQENKTICRLLNIHLREFYDDIYIPFDFFRNADWNISKILYDNEDILFYNKKYITKVDEERFYEVFDKFILMLEDIFSTNSKLFVFLKKWTDMSHMRWKTNNTKSYLKSLLTERKYQYISPAFTTNLFCEISKKYNNDPQIVKTEIEKELDNIVKKVKEEVKIFRKIYNEIVMSYVYEFPYNTQEKEIYVKAFINTVILVVLDFAEKLIELNVYAVHPIVKDIIGYYTPLDEINQYDPLENGNRKICIV